jgi:NAD(P)H-flavin reductase/ferredoxin
MSTHNVTIVFDDGRSVAVSATETDTIYLACLKNKIRILTDCCEGACATCKGYCPEGEYRLDDYSDEALSAEEAARREVLTCRMHALSDCVIEFPYDSGLAVKTAPQQWQTTVAAVEQVSGTVVRLDLALPEGAPAVPFLPGQYVHLAVPGTDQARSYSFANAPGAAGACVFYIKLLADGVMSAWLRDTAKPGDQVMMTGPFGRFYLRKPDAPVLMVAGGTGLAPMLSMLDHMVATGATGQPVRLLLGANREDELFAHAQVAGYKAEGINLAVERAVVEASAGWDGATGHVTSLLRPEYVADGQHIYLCGPPPMIEAAESWLAANGVEPARIHAEKFLPS